MLKFDENGRATLPAEEANTIREKLCVCGDCPAPLGERGEAPGAWAAARAVYYDVARLAEDGGSVLLVVAFDDAGET